MIISQHNGEQIARYVTRLILGKIKEGIDTLDTLSRLEEFEKKELKKKQISDKLRYLERKGRVIRGDEGGYELTGVGLEYLEKLKFKRLDRPESWDGLWRIISYDIPESKRPLRDAIRSLIKDLGMIQLQKSIWLTPYPCKRQFKELEFAYGQKGAVLYLEVNYIEGQEKYISRWSLQKM